MKRYGIPIIIEVPEQAPGPYAYADDAPAVAKCVEQALRSNWLATMPGVVITVEEPTELECP